MVSKDDFRTAFHTAVAGVLSTPQPPIRDNETFAEYGLDSLDIMNILLSTEEDLGINIGEMEVKEQDCFDTLYEQYAKTVAD